MEFRRQRWVENPNISNKDLDDTDIKYDSVNQEPDLSTDIKTRIEDKDSGSPLAGIFNSETNVKEQVKENEQMVNNNVDGGRTRQEQNRRLSRKNINDQ